MERLRTPAGLFWLLVCLAIAAVAVLFQLDRAARYSPQLTRLVPAGLGGFADWQSARLVIVNEPLRAERPLASLLRHRPIEAAHLSLFGLWAAEADKPDLAGRALTAAAGRGWRDQFVQVAVLGSALDSGRVDLAAARLDALVRTQREEELLFSATDLMMATPEGRAALVKRIGASDYFADMLVSYVRKRPAAETSAVEVIAALDRQGTGLNCDQRSLVARSMLARGSAQVDRVWTPACGKAGQRSFAFTFDDDAADPFNWTYPRSSGLSVRAGAEDGTLTLVNRDMLSKVAATRYVMLAPGIYTLTVGQVSPSAVRPSGMQRAGQTQVRVTCPSIDSRRGQLLVDQKGVGTVTLSVPDGCPVQQLQLFSSRGQVENLTIRLQ